MKRIPLKKSNAQEMIDEYKDKCNVLTRDMKLRFLVCLMRWQLNGNHLTEAEDSMKAYLDQDKFKIWWAQSIGFSDNESYLHLFIEKEFIQYLNDLRTIGISRTKIIDDIEKLKKSII